MKSAIALVPAVGPVTDPVFVHGMPLIERAVRNLLAAGCVRHVFLCTPTPGLAALNDTTVVTGDTRAGLAAALRDFPDVRFALIHDPERAATPPEVIKAVVEELERGARAVIPVLPLTDTVKYVADGRILGTRDREGLRVMQSPLGAPVEVLQAADGLLPGELGVPLSTVPGHPHGLRIRTPFDVASVTP